MNGSHVLTIVVITTKIETHENRRSIPTINSGSPPAPRRQPFWNCAHHDLLSRRLVAAVEGRDLSSNQYNVLRILRGAPEGLPCGEIGNRMITRDPDITRLLDRLEKRGLISRCRETKDRRMVMARITPDGLNLLARMDEPVRETHRSQLGHLGRERLGALTELLQAARG